MKTLFTIIFLLPLVVLSQQITGRSTYTNSPETIEERITKVLYDSGYSTRMVRIILAQARHESGNFTNKLTLTHCNVFAMRHPRKRPTTSLGPLAKAEGRQGYASFSSIEEATRDYILYSRYIKAPVDTTLEYYATFLHNKRYYECRLHSTGKGKCSRKNYSTALTNWMKAGDKVIVTKSNTPHNLDMMGKVLILTQCHEGALLYWDTREGFIVSEEGITLHESSNVQNILSHYADNQ